MATPVPCRRAKDTGVAMFSLMFSPGRPERLVAHLGSNATHPAAKAMP